MDAIPLGCLQFLHPSLPAQRPTHCVAVDFASSRLRYEDETEEEWRRAKQTQDEEGAIGWVIRGLLKRSAQASSSSSAAGTGGGKDIPVTTNGGSEGIGRVELGEMWRYEPSRRWDRRLTEDEQAAYVADPSWGFYKPKLRLYECHSEAGERSSV